MFICVVLCVYVLCMYQTPVDLVTQFLPDFWIHITPFLLFVALIINYYFMSSCNGYNNRSFCSILIPKS